MFLYIGPAQSHFEFQRKIVAVIDIIVRVIHFNTEYINFMMYCIVLL
jgi:hypothetical protein